MSDNGNGTAAEIQELVTRFVRLLVDNPDKVRVDKLEASTRTIIEIHVDKGDVGKVLGRQGRYMDALRTLIHPIGSKERHYYDLDLVDSRRH